MLDSELPEFMSLLDGVSSILSRGQYSPNPQNSAMFFRALQQHDLPLVRAAMDAHVKDPQRGRFVPTPADILAKIEILADDGRPGAEEAWAMVPVGEDQTVVWTTEMAEAYGACCPLLQQGDRIAARQTFKEVYEKLVLLAKTTGKPCKWTSSLGHDAEMRERPLAAAVTAGRLTMDEAYEACPALPMPESILKTLPAPVAETKIPELARELTKPEGPVDRLGWAKALRTKEEQGGCLTETQQSAWRLALQTDRPAVTMGAFNPIPNDCLPPGMRKGSGEESPWVEA